MCTGYWLWNYSYNEILPGEFGMTEKEDYQGNFAGEIGG